MTTIGPMPLKWPWERRPGRHVEAAGVGHRAAFVPLHAGLPVQASGYGVMLRLRPETAHLVACVGLRDGVAKALSVHVPGEDPHAFYRRHYPANEGAWMVEITVTEVVELGLFPVPAGFLVAGDVVELHRAACGVVASRLLTEVRRVCRTGHRFGFARDAALVVPACRFTVDVELYLGTELDGDGCVRHAVLEAI